MNHLVFITQKFNRSRTSTTERTPIFDGENLGSISRQSSSELSCPVGDLESCMAVCQSMPISEKYDAVCPNGPNSHSFCMDVCKEKCSENVVVYSGDCPGQNVEDCIRACPSNLKAFGACVRVCNWRCPSLDGE